MFYKRSALIAVFAVLGSAGCATTSQQIASNRVAGSRCEALSGLDQHVQHWLAASNIERIKPAYHEVLHFAGPKPTYVEGAEIYIPAEAGMNQAYLERAFSCYAASSSHALATDPLHSKGVRSVVAREAGQSFRVSILGVDREAGEEIWKRTQALRNAGVRVEVRQLSSAPASSPGM